MLTHSERGPSGEGRRRCTGSAAAEGKAAGVSGRRSESPSGAVATAAALLWLPLGSESAALSRRLN